MTEDFEKIGTKTYNLDTMTTTLWTELGPIEYKIEDEDEMNASVLQGGTAVQGFKHWRELALLHGCEKGSIKIIHNKDIEKLVFAFYLDNFERIKMLKKLGVIK